MNALIKLLALKNIFDVIIIFLILQRSDFWCGSKTTTKNDKNNNDKNTKTTQATLATKTTATNLTLSQSVRTLKLVVSPQFFSKTALRIFLIFCMMVVRHKISKLTLCFFKKILHPGLLGIKC